MQRNQNSPHINLRLSLKQLKMLTKFACKCQIQKHCNKIKSLKCNVHKPDHQSISPSATTPIPSSRFLRDSSPTTCASKANSGDPWRNPNLLIDHNPNSHFLPIPPAFHHTISIMQQITKLVPISFQFPLHFSPRSPLSNAPKHQINSQQKRPKL